MIFSPLSGGLRALAFAGTRAVVNPAVNGWNEKTEILGRAVVNPAVNGWANGKGGSRQPPAIPQRQNSATSKRASEGTGNFARPRRFPR